MKPLVLVLLAATTLIGCSEGDCEGGDLLYDQTLIFEGFDEHVGQLFELRSIWHDTVDTVLLPAIPAPEFTMTVVAGCGANHIDFYADFNDNGDYDPPPTDHAWRITVHAREGANKDVLIQHDTDYVDIKWPI